MLDCRAECPGMVIMIKIAVTKDPDSISVVGENIDIGSSRHVERHLVAICAALTSFAQVGAVRQKYGLN
jgi:hypothetical protein